MTYYIYNGNSVSTTPESSVDIRTELESTNYVLKFNEMSDSFYLEKTTEFKNPFKLYGKITKDAERCVNTFKDRDISTGLLFSGEKGSGKTQLAKLICTKMNVPVILINEPFCGTGFNQFISSIEQECIIFFDEFEKVYKKEDQQGLLTLFDGITMVKKLFILTCNNIHLLDVNIINRPSRIYYHLPFKGVDEAFIKDYCEDKAPHLTDKILIVAKLFLEFNFDMLASILQECLRYGIEPIESLEYLNIEPDAFETTYTVELSNPDIKLIRWDQEVKGTVFKKLYIDYTKEDLTQNGKESGWIELELDPKDFTKETSLANSIYVYNVDGFRVVLKPKIYTNFDYKQLF